MPKTLDFVVSARCRSIHLAAILRYYRTKSDNPPRTKGTLVSAIIADFYTSLKAANLLVPFLSSDEALEYLGSQQITKRPLTTVEVLRESQTEGSEPSNNDLANELFKKLES